jgi:hypothetical protein
MNINIYNAETNEPYGACKVPLAYIMRQGQPQKVLAHDFDVYESSLGTWMGSLRMMFHNTG